MAPMKMASWALAVLAAAPAAGYYLPGVTPIDYEGGVKLPLKVGAMTSTETELPYDFYSLGYCKPRDGAVVNENDNLGEFLSGEKIEKSGYNVFIMKPEVCRVLCMSKLAARDTDKFMDRIEEDYLNHWIVDNMPAASIDHQNDDRVSFKKGFPVGYQEDDKVYLYNHHSILLKYHEVQNKTFRVVGFEVEPFSVNHEFQSAQASWDGQIPDDAPPFKNCPSVKTAKEGTLTWSKYELKAGVATNVIFTYDVIWQASGTKWASRWDMYLESDVSAKVHWMSITNSLVVVLLMTGMIILILVRALRRDINRYTRVPTDEDKADAEEDRGWKLIHGDVFRPPERFRLVLCVLLGAGAQLVICIFSTICFAALGFLSPAYRGSYIIGALFTYVLASSVSGYVSAVFFKNFGGLAWKYNTFLTAFLFPLLLFSIFLTMNFTLAAYGSTGAVPFSRMLLLIFLWFFVSVPLTFLGSYWGYSRPKWELPMGINMTKRPIPDGPPLSKAWITILLGGLLPFGACFTELFFIMNSIWANSWYYMFGFLALVFSILIITCAEVAILGVYFQLTAENWAWWWRAFLTPGMTGGYFFLYAVWYWSTLNASMPVTYFLYFTYMGCVSFGVTVACGFVGVFASLIFIIQIFGSIKVD